MSHARSSVQNVSEVDYRRCPNEINIDEENDVGALEV